MLTVCQDTGKVTDTCFHTAWAFLCATENKTSASRLSFSTLIPRAGEAATKGVLPTNSLTKSGMSNSWRAHYPKQRGAGKGCGLMVLPQ